MPGEGLAERRLARDRDGRGVRRMVVVGWHLHGQLPVCRQRGGQTPQQRRVIGRPVERGVGEDEIVFVIAGERADVAGREAQAVARVGRGLRQHRRRVVDAERLPRSEMAVERPRQLAGAAPEIDDAHPRPWLHQRHQIEEGLRPLVAKAAVLLGVPVGRG